MNKDKVEPEKKSRKPIPKGSCGEAREILGDRLGQGEIDRHVRLRPRVGIRGVVDLDDARDLKPVFRRQRLDQTAHSAPADDEERCAHDARPRAAAATASRAKNVSCR